MFQEAVGPQLVVGETTYQIQHIAYNGGSDPELAGIGGINLPLNRTHTSNHIVVLYDRLESCPSFASTLLMSL